MSKLTVSKGAGAQASIGSGANSLKTYGNPLPYIMPLAAALVVCMAGLCARLLARDTYAWYWSPGVALAMSGLTYVAWRASRPRGKLTCQLTTGGMALGSAWVWYVAGVPRGALTWRPFVLYLLGAVVVVGGSWFLTALRDGGQPGTSMHDRVHAAIQQVKAINEVQVIDGQVRARYEMQPGVPASELGKATENLAALYGAPPGSARAITSKTHAGEGEMRISPVDVLATPRPYLGPSIQSGGTPLDPYVFGIRAGGQPLYIHLAGDAKKARNASNIQVTGMTGAGKSEIIREFIVEHLSRTETEYWYGNPRKAGQEPGWVKAGAARWAPDRSSVIAMIKDLLAEVPERSNALGAAGHKEWVPGCGIPYRLVILDEIAGTANRVENTIVELAESVRSVGIAILVGLQRASGDRWPTSARSNFGTMICGGVKDQTDAQMALPEDVLDAGAAPWIWEATRPGYCYVTGPGIPEELWTEPGRSFKPNDRRLAEWATHYIRLRAGLESGTPPQDRPQQPVERRPARPVDPVDVAEGDDDPIEPDLFSEDDSVDVDELDGGELEDATAGALAEVLDDDEEEEEDDELPRAQLPRDLRADFQAADHTSEIPVMGSGLMSLRLSPKMSPEEARRHLRSAILDLAQRGIGHFKVEDLGADVLEHTGMSASWLSKWLGVFSSDHPRYGRPIIERNDDRGWYDILAQPTLTRASE